MKKIILMLVIASVAITSNTYAQYSSDALRFSQTSYGSTARFKAMGGAQIGVGGDMSSLSGNPAGLGLFTKSEFSLTPEFNNSGVNANYLGQNTNTTKGQLNINQIGGVFYVPAYKQKGQDTKKGLISGVFGIGYTRNNDFSTEINYGGSNNKNSIADYFSEIAGSTSPNNLSPGSLQKMAYDNFLISYDQPAGNYYPETYAETANPNIQRKNEVKSGSVSEFNFSGAANIGNKVYIGASIGLVDLKYNTDAQYQETGVAREYVKNPAIIIPPGQEFIPVNGSRSPYNLLFNQSQVTKGSGVNGRIGIIVRPIDGLRLGANFQTPTWFVIDDSYTEGLDNRGTPNKRGTLRGSTDSETYDFTYNLRTPLKGSFGASYVIAGQAIISADVDYIDYASMKFTNNSGNTQNATITDNNRAVKDNYDSAINYRIGAEYKINSISLRAGYALNGSPYKTDTDGFFDTKMYSGGLGYRVNNYFVDLAYQRIEANNTFSPYNLNNLSEPSADVVSTKNNVFLTLGLRF